MNKIAWIAVLVLFVAAVPVRAAVYTNIQQYIPTYEYIPGTNVDIGGTGLSTGTAYICFNATNISYITDTQAAESAGNFKVLAYALARYLYDAYTAVASSNRSSKVSITETVEYNTTDSQLSRSYKTTSRTSVDTESVAAD